MAVLVQIVQLIQHVESVCYGFRTQVRRPVGTNDKAQDGSPG